MILSQFINIYFKTLRLDKNFFNNKNNFGEAAIYFAISIILINSIISIIPNSAFLDFMGAYFGLGKVQGPSIKIVVFTSIIGWIIKTIYVHFVGVIIFPSKNTNCNFRKSLILVAFVQTPLILNIIIFDTSFLFLILITYIWYNICLIVGINVIYNYKNIFKATIIALAPLILLFIYIISNFAGNSVTLT